MTNGDDNKVVKLRQPQAKPAAGVVVDDPINPKSLLNMTELEQEVFLQQLRERRLRAAEVLRRAIADKQRATTVAAAIRLEKKQAQVQRLLERATKSLDKLEEAIHGLRALHLQYTDTDITKVTEDAKNIPPAGSKK